jgi:hypothetical protein
MEATISASSTEDSRYLAVKAVGAGFLVLLISTLLARAVTALVISTSTPHELWGVTVDVNRIREFTAALPEIAERTENAAFFVGGSVVSYGFSPKVFDARMREHAIDLRSYNVGVNGNVPEVDALTVRRIGDAYNHVNRRVRVMMIAFGAWAFADWFTGLNPSRNRSRLVKNAALLTETEIASLFLHEPHYASELLGVRILGGFGAPDSIGLLGERMFGGPVNGAVSPSWWFGADPPTPEPYDQAVRDARRGWSLQFGHWNDSVRGEFFQDRGDDEAYARLASFAVKPSEERIKWYDDQLKGDMKVRPELFALFLESVRLAQGFSDAVVVVVIPSNPVAGRLNAEGRRHFEEIKAEMRRTGASVLDLFEPPELTMADYLDISHLNEQTGKPIFSALLADRVADVLARQKR